MEIVARLNHLRIAPRKVRLVARMLAGKNVIEAEYFLSSIQKACARPLLKLLLSAKANAKHNFNLDPDTLLVVSCLVNDGPVLKRYMPRAHGSANVIRKRSSHVKLTLKELKPKKEEKKGTVTNDKKQEPKKDVKPKKETAKKATPVNHKKSK